MGTLRSRTKQLVLEYYDASETQLGQGSTVINQR
jgi:hypothetical protein